MFVGAKGSVISVWFVFVHACFFSFSLSLSLSDLRTCATCLVSVWGCLPWRCVLKWAGRPLKHRSLVEMRCRMLPVDVSCKRANACCLAITRRFTHNTGGTVVKQGPLLVYPHISPWISIDCRVRYWESGIVLSVQCRLICMGRQRCFSVSVQGACKNCALVAVETGVEVRGGLSRYLTV